MSAATCSRLLRAIRLLGCIIAALPIATAYADPDPRLTRQGSVFLGWEPLSAEALDRLRGGFVDLSGIKISFGLQRMVWLNGELVQSLALNVPDLGSLRKGSIGAVSVQGPPPVTPVPVSAAIATQPGAVTQPQSAAVQATPAQPQPTPVQPTTPAVQSSLAPTSTASAAGGSTSVLPGSVTSVIQNGPGNVVMPDVLKNLGPGVFTVVQNSLNGQTIQGLTVVNAQVSGLGSVLRNNTFLDLHLTLRGAGR
jgi:hypothetical protein